MVSGNEWELMRREKKICVRERYVCILRCKVEECVKNFAVWECGKICLVWVVGVVVAS